MVAGRTQGRNAVGSMRFGIGAGAIAGAGKVSINIPSAVAGASVTATATITGLKSTDGIIVVPPSNFSVGAADLVFQGARVSAANTVEVRVRNEHASATYDPAAIDFQYLILRY